MKTWIIRIVVGVIALAIAAQIHTPSALDHHMNGMMAMSEMDGMMSDLTTQFIRAVNEILLVAAAISAKKSSLTSAMLVDSSLMALRASRIIPTLKLTRL